MCFTESLKNQNKNFFKKNEYFGGSNVTNVSFVLIVIAAIAQGRKYLENFILIKIQKQFCKECW